MVKMPVRPKESSNFTEVLAMLTEDLSNVLLDTNDVAGLLEPCNKGRREVLLIFSYPEIEEQSVVFVRCAFMLVFDEKAVGSTVHGVEAGNGGSTKFTDGKPLK
jgi:hypothetical protein